VGQGDPGGQYQAGVMPRGQSSSVFQEGAMKLPRRYFQGRQK
jgi:hypothetical protein